jgi:hypothetical protein
LTTRDGKALHNQLVLKVLKVYLELQDHKELKVLKGQLVA